MNCDSPASASSRISLRTDCNSIRCPVSLKYEWSLLKKDENSSHPQWSTQINIKNLLGTKVDSKNLVIKEQMLEPGSSYKIKVDVLSANGSFGWAVYQFDTVASPSGGTCHGVQLDRKDVGSWLNITCQGWRDKHMPLSYEFFRELEDGELDMLSSGVWPHSVVYIPPVEENVVRFKVAVVNVLGAADTTGFSFKVFIYRRLSDCLMILMAVTRGQSRLGIRVSASMRKENPNISCYLSLLFTFFACPTSVYDSNSALDQRMQKTVKLTDRRTVRNCMKSTLMNYFPK